MSKIEEILEKATRLRQQGGGTMAAPTEVKRPVSPATPAPPLAGAELGPYKTEQRLDLVSPYLVSVTQPQSPVAEEYKKLKSVIIKLTTGERFLNTIMVTSTLKGEGKSITSLNIALALAQEYDHTVLLVDADLRRPSTHTYLGIPNEQGLSDCLMNGVDVGSVLVKTGIGRLSILPAGRPVQNPVELIASSRMKEFIQELKHRYPDRYVIIDTPPVLHFAEAYSIASEVDGVIFVVREGQVPIAHLKEAVGMLKGSNILGVVYNDVEVNRYSSYHYYSYKNYSDYAGQGSA
ncbi:XrtA-associated tyrosine autokinase [Geobacter sp.]|uniref:XrtA-associated tyrosine autokinase n=1 Tax=Geobacter sp. TaxID=46610 RepID=UPI001AC3D39B|nr:XrtA-associated tyrosine autokinase [Geobacter sp.]CAG0975748.1 Tyrosine-protein kinase YwqD [Anaerolineales bacterium]